MEYFTLLDYTNQSVIAFVTNVRTTPLTTNNQFILTSSARKAQLWCLKLNTFLYDLEWTAPFFGDLLSNIHLLRTKLCYAERNEIDSVIIHLKDFEV